jgi:cadmium resistance protein CadD (predicted permease)
MESPLAAIVLGIVAFATTNIDDALVLLSFFADKNFSARDVVIGQYAGMGTLYMVSAIASLISLIIPATYIGLLGLVPITIGTRKLWNLRRDQREAKFQSTSATGAPIRSLAVAAVTIANGGDNIAVYTALFASRSRFDIVTIGILFIFMTGLWCLAAHWLVNHRALGVPIRHHAQQLVPFVFIGLGILILVRTGTPEFWK